MMCHVTQIFFVFLSHDGPRGEEGGWGVCREGCSGIQYGFPKVFMEFGGFLVHGSTLLGEPLLGMDRSGSV